MRLTLELPDLLTEELEKKAREAGASVSEYVANELQRIIPSRAPSMCTDTHPIITLATRVRETLPADAASDLPTDFARNHDAYIHSNTTKPK